MKARGFDYVIIGAGSAGCTLANRLGEDSGKSILLLEAGPMDRNLLIHVPAGVYNVWRNPKLNWNHGTVPEPGYAGRELFTPRGRVVGGSSSINSMVYMRGHPLDFDGWAAREGMAHWAFEHCLPYFKAGEDFAGGASEWRGAGGPLGTMRSDFENPLFDAFIEAGGQAGQGNTEDPNGWQPEGVCRLDATKRHGRRCSAAVAHLRPALRRGNVTLMTGAAVQRICVTDGRASGVEVLHRGAVQVIEAGEVILSGGAINSPQLLMLSGIGPADHLVAHGIVPIADLPGVGANLQDHPCLILQYESLKGFPIHKVDQPIRKAMAGAQWVFTRQGMAASNIWEVGGLIRGNDQVDYANLQYHVAPVGFDYVDGKIQLNQAFAVHIDVLRPRSRGHVRLRSGDPQAKPALTFNYLTDPDDLQQMVEGVRKTRDLVRQPAFAGLAGREMGPSAEAQSDAEIAAHIQAVSESDFHPCGTCRMGMGADAVVDPQFRVHGVDRLRVVDASVFPRITSANLNAPTQMIAARAADFIAGRAQKPPERARYAFMD